MNVQTKRWARPLALFIALTMIMMYSFGGVVFASINDVKVHYKGSVPGNVIVVETTIEGIQYVAEASYSTGFNYIGAFKVAGVLTPLPVSNSFKLTDVNSNIYIKKTLEELTLEKSSATGNKSLNIFLGSLEGSVNYDLGVTKTVNSSNVAIGQTVTFLITVSNNSDILVEDVVVNDIWPAGITQGLYDAQQGIFDGDEWLVGTLASKETKTLTIYGTASAIGTHTNKVEVEVDSNLDSNKNNNSASVSVTVFDPSNPIKIYRF